MGKVLVSLLREIVGSRCVRFWTITVLFLLRSEVA